MNTYVVDRSDPIPLSVVFDRWVDPMVRQQVEPDVRILVIDGMTEDAVHPRAAIDHLCRIDTNDAPRDLLVRRPVTSVPNGSPDTSVAILSASFKDSPAMSRDVIMRLLESRCWQPALTDRDRVSQELNRVVGTPKEGESL